MDDLESRLRAAVTSKQREFTSSDDMTGRIETRVRRRQRHRQQLAGAGLVALLLLVAATSLTLRPGDGDGSDVRMDDGGQVRTSGSTASTPTTTTEPGDEDDPPSSTTSTTTQVPPTSSTTLTPPSSDPVLWRFTPLHPRGIGPINVGMTGAEAEAATGVTFTFYGPTGTDTNWTCAHAELDGQDIGIELELPGGDRNADPRTGVIRAVRGNATREGLYVGMAVADLDRIYGPPTRTLPYYFGGDEVRIYEVDGYAYAATVGGGVVKYLTSGEADWQDTPEACQMNPAAAGGGRP